MTCCGKRICSGCVHAPVYDHQGNEVVEKKCPFCRTPAPTSDEEMVTLTLKRIEAEDSNAMCNLGCDYEEGNYGLPQNYAKAVELWHRAAELGDARACFNIGYAYDMDNGVEVDKKKAAHYYELAAMMGNASARHNLGSAEARAGNMDRALKHYTIAVEGGHAPSLDTVKNMYADGDATKDDYMKALRSYQAYLSEIKSVQRDKAAAAREDYRYY